MHFSAFPCRAPLIRSADTARHTQRAPCTHEQRGRPAGPAAAREKAIATTAPGIHSGPRARGRLRATRERTRARARTHRAATALADARDVRRTYTFEAGALQWRDTASDAGGRAQCHVTRLRADQYFVDYVDSAERATSVSVVNDGWSSVTGTLQPMPACRDGRDCARLMRRRPRRCVGRQCADTPAAPATTSRCG
ncbi:MoaF N-terminal domain-containing protein [Burkholderia vietnamiensis]|uniref:MoaF N-terminal domain-containing protein n=1 Tax=Burkholderia vietnamiensis TaxID=60552 RepID=UPI0020115391|nr:MoaF N-terminal domain-containing protein [Burkholderia vietnamiensis]